MIKTESEYQECLKRLEEDLRVLETQRKRLEEMKLPPEQVDLAMEPVLSFHAQLKEEVEWYERVKRRDFGVIKELNEVGPLLVALRITNGITQTELARRLGVDVSQISRDERNDYHGVSIERADKILRALGEELEITVGQKRLDLGLLAAT
ncbi:MAG: helix-turn-helix domain-containing protein [Candidatus Melainabacteria bacterium]|nr:helix-turn-helix domain-containing protein [Candidatus Melainabacteria bacterium]